MKHLIIAILLSNIGVIILVWGLYNMLVPQYVYSGPTPMATIVAIPLIFKAYKEYKVYKNMSI